VWEVSLGWLLHRKDVKIHNIFSSPEHNYFTREKFDVGDASTQEHKSIELEEGKGIKGDRFEFSTYPVTLFSLEVAEAVCQELELALDLKLFRRNIIISGVHLNSLIGEEFTLGRVKFRGLAHCSPCPWMNAVFKKGAYALMRGRGGLRVEVLSAGSLESGKVVLESEKELLEPPLKALKRASIPS